MNSLHLAVKVLFLVPGILYIVLTGIKAQDVTVMVKDIQSGEEISYAAVSAADLTGKLTAQRITDKNGKVVLPLAQKTVISISSLGYKTLVDTIQAGTREMIYRLEIVAREIGEVVVTGQHRPVSIDKSIYDIRLIGRDKIENKAASNLADILSDELNIRLLNDPSTGTGISLQGISGENIKILIDGVPVIGRLEGNIDVSQLTLDNVNHIEIVEGPMSVVYGSDALGGVINIISEKRVPERYKVALNSYYESIGIYNFNLSASVRQKDHGLGLNAGRHFFGGYSEEAGRSKVWKPKEQYNAGLTYYFTGNTLKMRFKSGLFRERLLDRNEPFARHYGNDTWHKTFRFDNSIELSGNLSRSSDFSLLSSYSYYERERLKYLVDLTDLDKELTTLASDHDTSTFGAFMVRGVYSYVPGDRHISLQAGFDAYIETAEGKRIDNNREDIGDYAVFTSLIWDPFKGFTLQPGLRAAYNTKYDAPLVPSFNVMYKTGKTILRASWARGFRSPSLKELYLYFYDSNHQIEGNDALQAERSHNFMFSADHSITYGQSTFLADFKAYYNLIDDKISLVQVDPDNPLNYRNENTGNFRTIGMDLSGTYYLGAWLTFKSGFSRIGRKDGLFESTGFIYSNNFSAGTNIGFLRNTARLSVFYKFNGKYPVYFYDSDGFLTSGYVNGYHSMDISMGKRFLDDLIYASSGVKNLFDNTDVRGVSVSPSGAHGSSDDVSSLVGWGRTYFINLKINLSK